MAADNVEFYERLHKLQAIQEQREQQRMSLERELNSYLKSDRRLSRVRASQLQSYWAKICEDERRSRARNDQLLREYERVEAQVAALSARTERLRLLKDQYEKQIEMMYPRWREEVEIKRRQRLMQQQKEQQQMARQIKQLQQQQQQKQQSNTQLQAMQQRQPNYSSLNQQQQEQHQMAQKTELLQQQQSQQQPMQQFNYHSPNQYQMQNVDYGYNHLSRTSPVIPSIQVQANTPPQVALQDPSYASIQFGTQLPSRSYGAPTTQYEHLNRMNRDTGNYEVPIGGDTLMILNKQPQVRNGSALDQQIQSGVLKDQVPGEASHVRALPTDKDTDYTKLHSEVSVPVFDDTSPKYPSNSSMYSEAQIYGGGGSGSQHATIPGSHSQMVINSKNQLPAAHIENQHTNSRGDAPPPQQDPHSKLQETRIQNQPAERRTSPTNDNIPPDDDSIVTPLNDADDAYLEPSAVRSTVRKTQLMPAERTNSAVSAKAISTARTDPFTSEDEDSEDSGSEEQALRHVLQRQLNIEDNTAPGRNQASVAPGKGQARPATDDHQKEMSEGKRTNFVEKPQQVSGVTQSNEAIDKDNDKESESESEIASDLSLPLNDNGGLDTTVPDHKPAQRSTTAVKSQDTRSQPRVAMETVSEHGFWQMVAAVEQEIEESDNIEKIYNLPECTMAIKNEIVKTVNNDRSLEYLNPNAISMVVLEQLQQIAHSMPGSCLLSDKLLDTKQIITEVTIRSFLYSSALGFWDKLLQHLVLLVRKGVMDAEEVASMVAPRLISPQSAFGDKAVDILTTILQDLEKQEDGRLDDTYSTLPSASATPSHPEVPSPKETEEQLQGPLPPVPPLDLGATPYHESPELETDSVSHDSFFDEPAVPLKETKAYQQMMQSSQGHTKPATQDVARNEGDSEQEGSSADEEDDEIERATRLSPETPPSSRNKKRRNILSSLGGSGSLGFNYGSGVHGSNDQDSAGDGSKRSEGMSDVISSASPSPSPKGSGYVQSAVEQSLKSTGRSDPTQRSAAFWGEESDIEESEMTVPMGTGTLKSDDFQDDFDFYD